MWTVRRVLPALLAAGLLAMTAACAGEQSAGRPSPAGTDASGSPGGASLVVVRAGGIAGFKDTVRVAPDGTATVTRRDGVRRSCRPDQKAVERVRRLDLSAVGPEPRPSTPVADAFSFTVTVGRESATAAEGERGRRAELVDMAGAVIDSCLTSQS